MQNSPVPLYAFAPLIIAGVALVCAIAAGLFWLATYIGSGVFHVVSGWHVGAV